MRSCEFGPASPAAGHPGRPWATHRLQHGATGHGHAWQQSHVLCTCRHGRRPRGCSAGCATLRPGCLPVRAAACVTRPPRAPPTSPQTARPTARPAPSRSPPRAAGSRAARAARLAPSRSPTAPARAAGLREWHQGCLKRRAAPQGLMRGRLRNHPTTPPGPSHRTPAPILVTRQRPPPVTPGPRPHSRPHW